MSNLTFDQVRRKLYVNPIKMARVSWDSNETRPYAFLECRSCEEPLVWAVSENWWVCRACGYECTPDEALTVTRYTIERIRALEEVLQEKSQRWGLAAWLRRLFRKPVLRRS